MDLRNIYRKIKEEKPRFVFTSKDGVLHRGWSVTEPKVISAIEEIFADVPSLYIADGHHRAASAVEVAKMRRREHPDYTGKEEFNSFLAVLFAGEELSILSYNRVLKDLGGRTPEEFRKALEEKCYIEPWPVPYQPEKKGTMGLCLGEGWYKLIVKEAFVREDPVGSLDVVFLQREVLEPLLGITDPRRDQRIDFIGGNRGLAQLEQRVHADCKAAFAMYPTSMEELYRVADGGLLMPPKSTWFEPKLLSGLFIHEIEK